MQKQTNLILDVDENPKGIWRWLILAVQHVLAMLVACITVPLIVNRVYPEANLPIGATLLSAGIGTLFYIFVTKKKSPVFLSSAFAYINPMISALSIGLIGGATGMNYFAIIIGLFSVALVYILIAILIKILGNNWINKILPPIVVGPVIIVIGLGLSTSAISNLTATNGSLQSYNLIAILCGLLAMIITALTAHYGKGTMRLIPFVIGMVGGYLIASIFSSIGYALNIDYLKIIDYSAIINNFDGSDWLQSFINYKMFIPNSNESFIFLRFEEIAKFDWKTIGAVILLFIPVSLVTVSEHVGDHLNLSNIIGHNIFKEVGLHRTLVGDGVATGISGALCGAANTTYGENVGVIGLTKIASVNVVILSAILAIAFGLFTPFTTLLETVPSSVCGGISLLLYGFIASSGIKMLVIEKINFSKTKNILVSSIILVSGIGGLTLKFGDANNPTFQITSIAVAMLLGIFLNLILKDRSEKVTNYEK